MPCHIETLHTAPLTVRIRFTDPSDADATLTASFVPENGRVTVRYWLDVGGRHVAGEDTLGNHGEAWAWWEVVADELAHEHGLTPVERGLVVERPRWCESCGARATSSAPCRVCVAAIESLSAIYGPEALAELASHAEYHAVEWAGRVRYGVRCGQEGVAGAYATSAARHGIRAMNLRAALALAGARREVVA